MRGTVHRKDIRHEASAVDGDDTRLLRAVAELQARFIAEHDSTRAFIQTLSCLLELTESEYGFISELEREQDGTPWLRALAITNLAWNDTTKDFFAAHVQSGLEFRNLDNLFGEVVKTGQVVISNDRENDPRSGGIPDDHPELKSFLGIPFRFNGEVVGMLGIANRGSGYSDELVNWLEPLTDACSTMVAAVHSQRERQKATDEVRKSEEYFRLVADLTAEVTFETAVDSAGVLQPVSLRGNLSEVLGVTEAALVESRWKNYLHPDDIGLVGELIAAVKDSGTGRQLVRWIRPDNETRHLRVSARLSSPIQNPPEDDEFRMIGCVVDVTDVIKNEASLREMVERHQAILQAVPDLIFLTTREGRFIETWAGDGSQLLVPADQLLGRLNREFLPPAVCDQWDAAVIEAESSGETPGFEYSLQLDGETRWYEARVVSCCRDRKAVLTVVRDITDRWDAEEAEARQFALLKAISDNSAELIFVKDTERRLLFMNHAAAATTGIPADEVIGTTADERLPADASRRIQDTDRRVLSHGHAVKYEETLPGPSGDRIYLTSKTPWRSRSGEILGLIGISQDITELKNTHSELDQSRRFVESIAEASPHVISVFDVLSHKVVWANRQFEDVLQLAPADITNLGEDLLPSLIHPDDLPAVYETLSRLETSPDGDVIEQQCRIRTGSGEWRWCLHRTTVFKRTDDGQLQQIISTTQDVTDRVEAQLALQESEARLRAIIEQEPECVKLVARDGTLLEMNSAGLSFTGAESLEDVVGRCVFDLIAPEFREKFREFHEKVCGGEAGTLEMEIIGLKGVRRRMETHAVPLKYGPEGEVGQLAVTRDVTDVRRAEELIAAHQAQLLHVSRLSSLGQMAAAISHEITQPLSAISNYAAACRLLLKREQPDLDTFSRHIETIAAQTHRAGETLDRIRTFIRGGNSPKQSCDIADVITGALDLMKAELRNRQVRVEFRSPETLPAVMADRIQIQQVITNLVTNACDAMQRLPENERAIDIICQHDTDHIVINVEDTGPGLNDLSQETLFEAFSTSKSEGMGLGLAICRDIVTAHGGTIVAANAPTRGAVFQFTLPVSKEA